MFSPPKNKPRRELLPRFEALEERLLLTTLMIGEGEDPEPVIFSYNQLIGEEDTITVAVVLNGDAGDAVELLAAENMGSGLELMNVPGVFATEEGDITEIVPWPGGLPSEVYDEDDWVDYDEEGGVRGAVTGIFAIYFARASSSTYLSIRECVDPDPDEDDFPLALADSDAEAWTGEVLLFTIGDDDYTSGAGSGSVLIGSRPQYGVAEDDPELIYVPADPGTVLVSGAIGVFPGGPMFPGVTVADVQTHVVAVEGDEGLGDDVQAIVTAEDGTLYVVDSGVFNADEVGSIGAQLGALQDSLAVADGTFYTVNNARGIVQSPSVSFGGSVGGLAQDASGDLWAVTSSGMLEVSRAGGVPEEIGYVIDASSSTYGYDVAAMDFDPVTGELYAIATLVDRVPGQPPILPGTTGPFLIRIDQTTAKAYEPKLLPAAMPSPLPNLTALDGLAFNDSGDDLGTLYWSRVVGTVDSQNILTPVDTPELHTIDPATGQVLTTVPLSVAVSSIDFSGGRLFGTIPYVSGNLALIDPDTGQIVDLGEIGAGWVGDLTGDADDPNSLWTVDWSGTRVRIALDYFGQLLAANEAGSVTDRQVLLDGVGFSYEIHAMDTGPDGQLWGIATRYDADLSDVLLFPVTVDTELYLVAIDPTDGTVVRKTDPIGGGITAIETLAINSAGEAYIFDEYKRLYTLDLTTGIVDMPWIGATSGVSGSITGAEFIPVGDNEVLVVCTAGDYGGYLYAIDPADADTVLFGETDFQEFGGIAFYEDTPDVLWGIESEGGVQLYQMRLSAMLTNVTREGSIVSSEPLYDQDNADWTYHYVSAADTPVGGTGEFYAFGSVQDLDPFHGNDAPVGAQLLRVDPETHLAQVMSVGEGTLNSWSITIGKVGGSGPPVTSYSSDVSQTIPGDNTFTTSDLSVTGVSGIVISVDVTLDITHPYAADLDVYLISPLGTEVELFTDVGGLGENFSNTTLDDGAAGSITLGTAPFTGSYQPEGSLATLNGVDPNGTWQLKLRDDTSLTLGEDRDGDGEPDPIEDGTLTGLAFWDGETGNFETNTIFATYSTGETGGITAFINGVAENNLDVDVPVDPPTDPPTSTIEDFMPPVIAADSDGLLYVFDNVLRLMKIVDPESGPVGGGGGLSDSVYPTFGFERLTTLTSNPNGDVLYGVGYVYDLADHDPWTGAGEEPPTPEEALDEFATFPWLFSVNSEDLVVTRIRALYQTIEGETVPVVLEDLAFDDRTSTLWGRYLQYLLRVDPQVQETDPTETETTTPEYPTDAGGVITGVDNQAIRGMDFLDGYLYVVTDENLYVADATTSATGPIYASARLIGPMGDFAGQGVSGLTRSPIDPTVLYGTVQEFISGKYQIKEIRFGWDVVTVDYDVETGTGGGGLGTQGRLTHYQSNALTMFASGIDFVDGRLFGITDGVRRFNGTGKFVFYEFDPLWTFSDPFLEFIPQGGPSDLTVDRDYPGGLFWTPDLIPSDTALSENYELLAIFLAPQDIGRLNIAGTLAGTLYNPGSLGIVQLGFLWGNILVDGDIQSLVLRNGGGGILEEGAEGNADVIHTPTGGSTIQVGGALAYLNARPGGDAVEDVQRKFYSSVHVVNDPTILRDSIGFIEEVEYLASDEWSNLVKGTAWRLVGMDETYRNDTMEDAQFLAYPTGDFALYGRLQGGSHWEARQMLPEEPYDDDHDVDWYALPLDAGQTIVLTGKLAGSLESGQLVSFEWEDSWLSVRLFDSQGNWVATYGHDTVEDEGIDSRGETTAPLVFTAPTADIYYIAVVSPGPARVNAEYLLYFENATDAALGGVCVLGEADGAANFLADPDIWRANIIVDNAGGIGGYFVSGHSERMWVYERGGGGITAYVAGTIGGHYSEEEGEEGEEPRTWLPDYIQADGSIGLVFARGFGDSFEEREEDINEGFYHAYLEAGAGMTVENTDAHLQVLRTMSDLDYGSISVTGSIGTIDVRGTIAGADIHANSDGIGPNGHIDLIDVGNNWGGWMEYRGEELKHAPPSIWTGPGGDVGFIHIDGPEIWIRQGGEGIGDRYQLLPTYVTDGSTETLIDDGGGQITITPEPVPLLDEQGNQQFDAMGQIIQYVPAYSYTVIGVNGDWLGGSGGVIVNLAVDGPASFYTKGEVQISNLDTSWSWYSDTPEAEEDGPPAIFITEEELAFREEARPEEFDIVFTGPGRADIYHLTDHPQGLEDTPDGDQTLEMLNFYNDTEGDLIGGYLANTNIGTLHIEGSIGPRERGAAGARIFGAQPAPALAEGEGEEEGAIPGPVVPGQYYDRFNGLWVTGSVEEMWIGGSLGDLYITGVEVEEEPEPEPGEEVVILRDPGTIGVIIVNADGITPAGEWDGIDGVVWAEVRIEEIHVGDGVADDGTAGRPEAGIFSSGRIEAVYVTGPRYEVAPSPTASLCEQLQGPRVFNEINGAIIGVYDEFVVVTDEAGEPIVDANGVIWSERAPAVGLVRGTNGATLTGLVLGMPLDSWWSFKVFERKLYNRTGSIETVSFSGYGAEIDAAEIDGIHVGTVRTSADANGINDSWIVNVGSIVDTLGIGSVIAGGGMYDTTLNASGSGIGVVKATGSSNNIYYSSIVSAGDVGSIVGRDFRSNGIYVTGTIGTINATGDMVGTVVGESAYGHDARIGALKTLSVGGDFMYNQFNIAGALNSMTVGGAFIGSVLTMYGPTTADLKSLVVNGDISGRITSYGRIGKIVSRNGAITAHIATIRGGWDSDVDRIESNGYTGSLSVGGTLKNFVSRGSLGSPPLEAGSGANETFDVVEDLLSLRIDAAAGDAGNLYANVNVGGDIGAIDIDGTLFGDVITNGGLKKLDVGGALGGQFDVAETFSLADGTSWPSAWGWFGDTDELLARTVQGGRGLVQGDTDSSGTVLALVDVLAEDVDQTVTFSIDDVDGGFGAVARKAYENHDSYYAARVIAGDDASLSLRIYKVVDGVWTELADTGLLYDTPGASELYKLRVSVDSSGGQTVLRVKMWQAGQAEPTDWAAQVTDDESCLQNVKGRFGLVFGLADQTAIRVDDYAANFTGGSLTVFGEIRDMRFNPETDIFADLTLGGSIKNITLRNADILGDLTSRYGSFENITVKNGSILGDVTAQSIGKINVTNGDIGTADKPTSITTSQGGIDRIQITGGDLIANVYSAAQIDRLMVRRGSDITGDVVAGSYIGLVQTDGAITGAIVAAGSMDRVTAASLTDAIISAGWNIGRVQTRGNVTDSMILAGYDVGADGAVGGGDDHRATGSLHSGNIDQLNVSGRMSGSTVAAGVDPTDPDTQAAGTSVISKVSVRGGFGPSSSRFLAESGIDARFYAAAQANPMVEVPAGFISEVKDGAGTDFGPGTTAGNKLQVGDLTLTLTNGRANYDPATGILVLEATTERSSLTLRNTADTPVTIHIESSDDSALANLKVIGNVILGDVAVDGPIRTLTADQVAAGATWQLPGGVSNLRIKTPGDLNVTAGEIRNWQVGGAFSGSLTADAIRTAKFDSAMSGDLTALVGDALTVQVLGGGFSGVAEVLGETKTVMVRSGSFSGSYRTGGDLQNFKVNQGNFSGVLCVGGELRTLMVNRGQMSGEAWAGGEIRTVNLGWMNGGMVATSGDLRTVNIRGNMTDSYLFAGFNPGDAGYGAISGELGNLQIDAFSGGDDPDQTDVVGGGSIRRVNIRGSMIRSTISAAVGPGLDGYVGTADDVVAGAGAVDRVRVSGGIVGTAVAGESYGVFAAGELPTVVFYGRQPFRYNGNAHAAGLAMTAGNLAVTDVTQTETELIITFNHGIRFDVDSAKALISVLASEDTEFVPGEDTDLWDYLYDPVYDAAAYTITLTLLPYLGLWANLAAYGLGDKVQLSIDGTPDGDPAEMDALRDNRGFVLDGEFYGVFPTGNGVQGGDFLYHYEEGPVVLEDVPSYDWWFGCSPTAAAMLVGYYDGQGYDDLIEGDASTQTDEVNEAIASSGDGIYDGDSAIVEGTPGTGHIPDYALYDGYNDYYDSVAYTDLSQRDLLDPDPGVDPHADDCLADFMMTSWSSKGHTMGGTWSNEIGAGVEAYFAYQGYQAFYQHLEFGQFTWATLINEINHDRPVLLTVDWNGQGEAHSITVIGYDAANRQYAFYDTWSVDDPATPDVDEAIRWTDFHGLIYGDPWGIYDGIIIYAA